jgi:hypothetical protein
LFHRHGVVASAWSYAMAEIEQQPGDRVTRGPDYQQSIHLDTLRQVVPAAVRMGG